MINEPKLSIFNLFSMFINIFHLKLRTWITFYCLQQTQFSYFSYFHTYAYEWQKRTETDYLYFSWAVESEQWYHDFNRELQPRWFNNAAGGCSFNLNGILHYFSHSKTYRIRKYRENIWWKNDVEVLYVPFG